ncbi:hypothetical protein GCM10027598_48650 [Amycolatopsis oliviviridis]|uniref:Uncharacterized protein n=1 Tax=Amycolatopsis oliviviridis TaxID=1471590 RepID=A0ABQ3M0N9_9PSEU|nr:hypothetical protein GCM10017790_65140 [Amycolatopsis oliviviridis]
MKAPFPRLSRGKGAFTRIGLVLPDGGVVKATFATLNVAKVAFTTLSVGSAPFSRRDSPTWVTTLYSGRVAGKRD